MLLYHFTSARHLRPIASHGLTVGDVPTDIRRRRGRVGVWLTSSTTAAGHGLEGSSLDKTRYRLSVEAPEGPLLVRWEEWAPSHVTEETVAALHTTAAKHAGEGPGSWYIYFGVLSPSSIRQCVDMATGLDLEQWGEISPPDLDVKAVPAWRREAWQRQMLKQVDRALAKRPT